MSFSKYKIGEVVLEGVSCNNVLTGETFMTTISGNDNVLNSVTHSGIKGDHNNIQDSIINVDADIESYNNGLNKCNIKHSFVYAKRLQDCTIVNSSAIVMKYSGDNVTDYGTITQDVHTSDWHLCLSDGEYPPFSTDFDKAGDLNNYVITTKRGSSLTYSEYNPDELGYGGEFDNGQLILIPKKEDGGWKTTYNVTVDSFCGTKIKPDAGAYEAQDLMLFVDYSDAPMTRISCSSTGKIYQYNPEDLIERLTEQLP